MIEPRRLREQGAPTERALLESARADAPPEGATQRMLVALGGVIEGGSGDPGSAAGSSGLGGATGPALKLGTLAKVGLVALAGMSGLGGGVLLHRLGRQPAAVSPAPTTRAEPRPTTAAASSAASPLPGLPAADDSLAAEILVLDTVRAALDRRNPTAARRALDGYTRRFARGRLQPEATVLELAVLVQEGNRPAVKALAAKLLASPPYQAYQYRIRSLLRESGE